MTYPPQAVLTTPDAGSTFIHNNATVTASGSFVVAGVGAKEVTLVVNATVTPTGTTPALTYTLQEVDPGNQTSVFGPIASTSTINAIGVYTTSLGATVGGAVKISWTVTGAGASFTGVYATASSKVGTASTSGAVIVSDASIGTNNTAIPTSSSQFGGSDGTNLQSVRVFDADTGGGTQYVLGTVLRKSASGGSVEAGTSADPLRVDPTGTTTQPISASTLPLPTGAATETTLGTRLADATFTARINTLGAKTSANSTPVVLASDQSALPITDNAGSLTVDSPQLPAALVGGRLDENVGAWLGSTAPTVGAKTSANSVPVVIASDQSAVPVSGTVTANIGTAGTLALDATLTGGTLKAIARGGVKGSTTAADVTSTAEGADHQSLDVQLYHGGTAINPTAIRALTSSDVVTSAQGTAAALSGGWPVKVTDGTNSLPTGDNAARSIFTRTTDGTNTAAVKAASTAAVASDPALVVAISPNNPISVSGAADATGAGALGALNAAVQVTTAGLASVGFQLAAGTLVGTIVPEVSFDGGTTWVTTYLSDPATGIKASSVVFAVSNTATAREIVAVGGSGLTRIRVSAYTSGTANITLRASMMDGSELPRYTTAGAGYTVLTSPNALPLGISSQVTSYGTLKVTTEGSELFVEPFDGGTIDVTDRWNTTVVGTGSASQASGTLTITTGTTVSNAYALTSKNLFRPIGLGFQIYGNSLKLEAVALTNNHRFWGLGTPPVTWAAATPLQDGLGFEQDITGALNAVTYSGGTRTIAAVLARPSDGAFHRYAIYVRADLVYWYYDSLEVPVASANWPALGAQTLPIRIHSINHTSGPSSGPTFQTVGIGITETSHSGVQISDGNFAWRKATVKPTSTAALATDTALVVTRSPVNVGTAIHSNATITADGNTTVLGKKSTWLELAINITATPTGTNPTLTFVVSELDPATATTVIGSSVSTVPISASGVYRATIRNERSNTLKVAWDISGTSSPTFTGVNVTLIEKDTTSQLVKVGDGGHLATSGSQLLFLEDLSSISLINTWYLWTTNVNVMVAASDTNGLNLNSTSSTTASAYSTLSSKSKFPLDNRSSLVATFTARVNSAASQSFIYFGFGELILPLAPGSGMYFKINNTTNEARCVVSSTGGVYTSEPIAFLNPAVHYTFKIYVEGRNVRFTIGDAFASSVLYEHKGVVADPDGFVAGATTAYVALFIDVNNAGGTAGAAPLAYFKGITVHQLESAVARTLPIAMAGVLRGALTTPGSSAVISQISEAAPAGSVPVNTNFRYSTLGGEYLLTAATSNENIRGVFGWTNPTSSIFYLTDLYFPPPAVTTAMAATVSIHAWFLTTNGATATPVPASSGPFPLALGTYTVAASAVVGTIFNGPTLQYTFQTPIAIVPGRYLGLAVKYVSSGNSGAFRGLVSFNGFFE